MSFNETMLTYFPMKNSHEKAEGRGRRQKLSSFKKNPKVHTYSFRRGIFTFQNEGQYISGIRIEVIVVWQWYQRCVVVLGGILVYFARRPAP